MQAVIDNPEGADLDLAIADLARWIGYFQHERLIHLIVTALVALIAMMSVIILVVAPSYPMIALILLLAVLLIFYIKHYYLLENSTQTFYEMMDTLLEIKRSQK